MSAADYYESVLADLRKRQPRAEDVRGLGETADIRLDRVTHQWEAAVLAVTSLVAVAEDVAVRARPGASEEAEVIEIVPPIPTLTTEDEQAEARLAAINHVLADHGIALIGGQ